ncbi:DUF397 domain-containing protein [Streptomyces albidoflavus]|uniref:DUF397 domain-containing protein n=1 Tax=Streptomyces albidoflavus TaxID=1886 RepID=A0AB37XHK6_9ACTN|nr:DUF397 domain-containing protein [Streptomyces sp. SM17]RZE22675.1 DUF397 domain-containing protein [Streptomyces albidoflavus]RZE40659.1 DUF397 domain-containing protein [Streptomyces albidoflavus]RZE43535.1 DUF397 domain-containing protein [Streptomyces albidoflavus]RZE59400.1 DUF397 domain-containing protein [Streptomyces albidoflavus]
MNKQSLSATEWVKSSYSGHDGGNCLELAPAFPGLAPVRDSKIAETGPVLPFTRPAWASFVTAVQQDELTA